MKSQISTLANEARNIDIKEENDAKKYIELKQYEYEYLDILESYVPVLLEREDFLHLLFNRVKGRFKRVEFRV